MFRNVRSWLVLGWLALAIAGCSGTVVGSLPGAGGMGGGGTNDGGQDQRGDGAADSREGSGGAPDGSGGASADAGGGGDSGTPLGDCGGAVICETFESYAPDDDLGPWTPDGNGGSVATDESRAYSGARSAHFRITPGGNRRVQLVRSGSPLFPVEGNAFWGRMMVWASNLPFQSNTEDKNVHYDVVQADGEGAGQYRVAGMGNVLLNYEPHDCYYGTDKAIPEDQWACWEWLFDGSRNVIEFYIDGELKARIEEKGQGCVDGTDSVWEAPQFDTLRLGWVNYQSMAETVDLWIDDVALGPTRVGCPGEPLP